MTAVSVVNRALVVLIVLIVLAGAIITLLVGAQVSTPDLLPGGWFEAQLQAVADAKGGAAAGIMAASLVIAVAMLVMLVFEFRPRRRAAFLMSLSENGAATIDRDSVVLLAEKTGATIHSVRHIKCSVRRDAGRLVLGCRVEVVMGADAVEIGSALQTKIKDAVEHLTGLEVSRVNVSARYQAEKASYVGVHR